MAFGIVSKFIGNQKLLKSNIIPSRAIDPTSWLGYFPFDTCTAGAIVPLWTPTEIGTGTVAHSAGDWAAIISSNVANADEALMISVPTFSGVDDGYSALRIRIISAAAIPAPAAGRLHFGMSTIGGGDLVELQNTAADTFRLVCTSSGGGTSNGTPFALDLTDENVIEFRLYQVGGVPDHAEVYVNDVLMDTIAVAANIPSPFVLSSYVYTNRIGVGGDVSVYVYYAQMYVVPTV